MGTVCAEGSGDSLRDHFACPLSPVLTEHHRLPEVSSSVEAPCAAHSSTAGQHSSLCCLLQFHLGPGTSTSQSDSKKGGFLLSSDCAQASKLVDLTRKIHAANQRWGWKCLL